MIDSSIKRIAEQLSVCYEEAYNVYRPQVKMIIRNKIKDVNYIEHTLDGCLDIYTDKGFYLFMELLLYYRKVNYKNAREYLEIAKEERKDEYKDFVKKIKKIKGSKKE